MACAQPIVASYADAVKKSIPGVPNISIPVHTCRSQSRTPSPVKDLQPSFFAPIKRSGSNIRANNNSHTFDRSNNGKQIPEDANLTQVWQLKDFSKQINQLVEDSVHRCSRCDLESCNDIDDFCSECSLETEKTTVASRFSSFIVTDCSTYGSKRVKTRRPDRQETSDKEELEGNEDIGVDTPVRSIMFKSTGQPGVVSSTSGDDSDENDSEEDEAAGIEEARAGLQSDASSISSECYSVHDETEVGSTGEEEEAIETDHGGTSRKETDGDEECHEDGPPRPPRPSRQNGNCTCPSSEYMDIDTSSYSSAYGACGGQSDSEHTGSVYPDIAYYYSNENPKYMESLDTFERTDCRISVGRPNSMSSTYSFPQKAAKNIEDVVNFWETDFQVDYFMVPCMGSWEKKDIIPDENLNYLDHKKYLAYKKLYQKWVGCGKSLERWYEKYWGYSLLGILRTKKYNGKTRLCNCCICPR